MSQTSRKRPAKGNTYPDIEDGHPSIEFDDIIRSTSNTSSTSRKNDGKDSGEDSAEETYADGTTVYHEHYHTHSINVEGGLENVVVEPYSEFGVTSGIQFIIGWIMCLFSYVIIAIFIWMIVELST